MSGERIAVVGAGLAGLSLAVQLQRQGFRGETTLFEARDQYRDDRRWSYWPLFAHPFSGLPAQRYPALTVAGPGAKRILGCDATPYTCVAAGELYAHAQALLADDPRFVLRMGAAVQDVTVAANHASVEVDGDVQRFDRVFDGRPPQAAPRVLQWFIGGDVTVPSTQPMPAPVLMDFDVGESGHIAFAYVLPQPPDAVLVQLTYFLPHGQPPPADAQSHWEAYVAQKLGLDPQALQRVESGAVPMHRYRNDRHASPRVQPIGTAAGWVRAATGYGFLDTQRAAARLAHALIHAPARSARVRPRSRIDDSFDDLFLDAMLHAPDRAAGWFMRLFQRCPTPSLIRFLSGEANGVDRLALMRALPPTPFLAALARRLRGAGA